MRRWAEVGVLACLAALVAWWLWPSAGAAPRGDLLVELSVRTLADQRVPNARVKVWSGGTSVEMKTDADGRANLLTSVSRSFHYSVEAPGRPQVLGVVELTEPPDHELRFQPPHLVGWGPAAARGLHTARVIVPVPSSLCDYTSRRLGGSFPPWRRRRTAHVCPYTKREPASPPGRKIPRRCSVRHSHTGC